MLKYMNVFWNKKVWFLCKKMQISHYVDSIFDCLFCSQAAEMTEMVIMSVHSTNW